MLVNYPRVYSAGSQYQGSQRDIGFNFGNNAPNYASGNAPYPSSDSAPYPSGNQSGFPPGPGAFNNSPYPSNPQMSGGYGAPPPPQNQYGGQNAGYPNIGQGAYPQQHQPSAPPQYATSYGS